MLGEPIVLAALGIVATIAGALIWLLKKLFTQNETTIRDNTTAYGALAKAISQLSTSASEQINANLKRDAEARKFQKSVLSKLEKIDQKADRNFQEVKSIRVEHQTVKHQTVVNEVVESAQGAK